MEGLGWNLFKKAFRLYAYSVITTPISVIYFGGYHNDEGPNDMIAEYKSLEWTELGRLASSRYAHRSIKWIQRFIFSADLVQRKIISLKFLRKFQAIISAILKSGRILDIWRHQVIKGPYWTNLMIMSSSPTIMEKFYESITTSVIYWISENAMRN